MGSLLSFAPRSAATTRKPIAPGTTASVIIFPGVRYERPDPVYGGYMSARPAQSNAIPGKPAPHCR
jgi:hypothetical protein